MQYLFAAGRKPRQRTARVQLRRVKGVCRSKAIESMAGILRELAFSEEGE